MNNIKFTAIIIEPRIHPALKYVLTNFIDNLDEDWGFIIFYGNENKDFVFNLINNYFNTEINRIRLINLQVNNISISDYSNIFYNLKFYEFINTEYFLIFQTDSLIRNKYKHYINKS
jgi:hypothetical protein